MHPSEATVQTRIRPGGIGPAMSARKPPNATTGTQQQRDERSREEPAGRDAARAERGAVVGIRPCGGGAGLRIRRINQWAASCQLGPTPMETSSGTSSW